MMYLARIIFLRNKKKNNNIYNNLLEMLRRGSYQRCTQLLTSIFFKKGEIHIQFTPEVSCNTEKKKVQIRFFEDDPINFTTSQHETLWTNDHLLRYIICKMGRSGHTDSGGIFSWWLSCPLRMKKWVQRKISIKENDILASLVRYWIEKYICLWFALGCQM